MEREKFNIEIYQGVPWRTELNSDAVNLDATKFKGSCGKLDEPMINFVFEQIDDSTVAIKLLAADTKQLLQGQYHGELFYFGDETIDPCIADVLLIIQNPITKL